MKTFFSAVAFTVLSIAPAFANQASITTTNEVVNAMMTDWAEYDAACRGTNPDQGSDGFCGARDYLGFALARNGVCLGENEDMSLFFKKCSAGDYMFADPLQDIRGDF